MEKLQIRYRRREQELESKLVSLGDPRHLDPGVRFLALAAAGTAAGRREVTRAVVAVALRGAVPPETLREAILQTYLFAGYPRAINGLAVLHSLAPGAFEENGEVDLRPRPGEVEAWSAAGEALCRKVYREKYPKLLRTMGRLSPDLTRWMVLEGYGKVLSRPALDSVTRELISVAALIPLSVPDQLRAHLRGALYVGATRSALQELLDGVELISAPGAKRARGLLAALEPVDLQASESSPEA
jgi:4-carboxymuconolactone decarboxylase